MIDGWFEDTLDIQIPTLRFGVLKGIVFEVKIPKPQGRWPWMLFVIVSYPTFMDSLYIYMAVSKNRGTPKSSILIGFSIINHPFWGTPIFGNTHIYIYCIYIWLWPSQWLHQAPWWKDRLWKDQPLPSSVANSKGPGAILQSKTNGSGDRHLPCRLGETEGPWFHSSSTPLCFFSKDIP